MDKYTIELLEILQEECAEVIQAISKIKRFGLESKKPGEVQNNQQHFEEEVGDMQALIELLSNTKILSNDNLYFAKLAKHQKLAEWSSHINK